MTVLDAPYDEAVRQAALLAEADPDALLVQDTSWPGYEEVPQWIVDGYATLFDEAADQAAKLGAGIDLVVVPAGVGSLAHAAVLFGRSRPGLPRSSRSSRKSPPACAPAWPQAHRPRCQPARRAWPG